MDLRNLCKYHLFVIFSMVVRGFVDASPSTYVDKDTAKKEVLEMFRHAYDSYMNYAYPADELMPLSCKGRVRGEEPSRGDIDDALGRFSLTLIDTLDTLAVLGLYDEFEEAVQNVIEDVTFDTDIVVSVFETNIRVLGGLLGGHVAALEVQRLHGRILWYNDELLDMAKDIGYRLLPAFNTTTGMPYPRVNLRHGIGKGRTEKDTCTACAGSMLLEFAALSRLTGEPIFEEKAKSVMHTLWTKRQRNSNLMGTVINIHTGDWVRKDAGVGAGIDSYYEYLLKGYILLGEEGYYDRFSTHYDAIKQYVNDGPRLIDVHMHRPHAKSRNFMDALLAFWPGLQVLFGDIEPAIETHEMLYQVTQRHNFLPEAFTREYDVYWGQHPLRPEFIESTYFLYQATNDPYYLEVGKKVIDSLQNHARVPCGFAGIKDVRTGSHEDRMDSFVLAETFKYLYLLFSEPEDLSLPIENFIFTTEAHILPLTLSKMPVNKTSNATSGPTVTTSPPFSSQPKSCPSHRFLFPVGKTFAEAVRDSLKKPAPESCPTSNNAQQSKNRLKASEFVPGNKDHMQILKKMGIQLVTLDDGRVQLMHIASKAATPEDADEGMIFMQEIIEITKSQQSESVEYHPRVVQVVSPLNLQNMVLAAGPAQFGLDLDSNSAVVGEVVIADPITSCAEILNCDQLGGKIVLMQRGSCMFVEKARVVESCGAIGGIIMDNNESSSSDTSSVFAMSGDGTNDVNIPVVFLFYKEGKILHDTILETGIVDVMLMDKKKPQDEVMAMYKSRNPAVPQFKSPVAAPAVHYYTASDEKMEYLHDTNEEDPQGECPAPPNHEVPAEHMMDKSSKGGDKNVPHQQTSNENKFKSSTDDLDMADFSKLSLKETQEFLASAENMDDLIQKLVEQHQVYINEEKRNRQMDKVESFETRLSTEEIQSKLDEALNNYWDSEAGQKLKQERAESALKHKVDAYNARPSSNVLVDSTDLEKVVQEIKNEYLKFESIRLAFDKFNPIHQLDKDEEKENKDFIEENIHIRGETAKETPSIDGSVLQDTVASIKSAINKDSNPLGDANHLENVEREKLKHRDLHKTLNEGIASAAQKVLEEQIQRTIQDNQKTQEVLDDRPSQENSDKISSPDGRDEL